MARGQGAAHCTGERSARRSGNARAHPPHRGAPRREDSTWVVFTGDAINQKEAAPLFRSILGGLPARLGRVAVRGNHDVARWGKVDLFGADVAGHKRAKRGRKPLDPALPRHIVRHELSDAERVCAHDGATLVEIGVEASEQLDIIPQQVRVIRHERVKYACPCCDGGLRLAGKPVQIIPKGLFSESALAWIATSKFNDGLPLYRQAALLGRFGGTDLSHNTMAASIVRVGAATQPVINLMRDHLLDSPLVFGDETTVQVLKEPGRAAQAKSYMWVQMTEGSGPQGTGPPIRLFGYSPSRSTDAALQMYAGLREGSVLMTDGYEVYDKIEKTHKLVHLGCWAHARRYMVDALQVVNVPATHLAPPVATVLSVGAMRQWRAPWHPWLARRRFWQVASCAAAATQGLGS